MGTPRTLFVDVTGGPTLLSFWNAWNTGESITLQSNGASARFIVEGMRWRNKERTQVSLFLTCAEKGLGGAVGQEATLITYEIATHTGKLRWD